MDRACKEGRCVGVWGRCAWYKDKVNLLAEVPLYLMFGIFRTPVLKSRIRRHPVVHLEAVLL